MNGVFKVSTKGENIKSEKSKGIALKMSAILERELRAKSIYCYQGQTERKGSDATAVQ